MLHAHVMFDDGLGQAPVRARLYAERHHDEGLDQPPVRPRLQAAHYLDEGFGQAGGLYVLPSFDGLDDILIQLLQLQSSLQQSFLLLRPLQLWINTDK